MTDNSATTTTTDAFNVFAEGWEDIPDDSIQTRPKVWVEAEVTEAATVKNDRYDYPQIEVTMKIHASGKDDNGKQASGILKDWLSKPAKGHAGLSEKRITFMNQMFRKAMVAMLAPDAENRNQADKQCLEAASAAGGFPQAIIGKRVLAKIGINDGLDKEGNVVSEIRAAKPVNRIDDYRALTESNARKYLM